MSQTDWGRRQNLSVLTWPQTPCSQAPPTLHCSCGPLAALWALTPPSLLLQTCLQNHCQTMKWWPAANMNLWKCQRVKCSTLSPCPFVFIKFSRTSEDWTVSNTCSFLSYSNTSTTRTLMWPQTQNLGPTLVAVPCIKCLHLVSNTLSLCAVPASLTRGCLLVLVVWFLSFPTPSLFALPLWFLPPPS